MGSQLGSSAERWTPRRFANYKGRESMVTATKWISVMALLLAMYGFRSANYFTVVAAFVVCAGAVVVLRQAFGKGQYLWAGASC